MYSMGSLCIIVPDIGAQRFTFGHKMSARMSVIGRLLVRAQPMAEKNQNVYKKS